MCRVCQRQQKMKIGQIRTRKSFEVTGDLNQQVGEIKDFLVVKRVNLNLWAFLKPNHKLVFGEWDSFGMMSAIESPVNNLVSLTIEAEMLNAIGGKDALEIQ